MKYKSQAYVGVIGLVAIALTLVLVYSFMTDVHYAIPLFSIPFMVGFAYYSYASLKEGREVKEKRKAGRKSGKSDWKPETKKHFWNTK